jgi:hypothetical protein
MNQINGTVLGVIGAVIFLAVGVALGPTVIEYLGYINATSMADVQLGAIIVLFASFGSLFYYLGIVAGAIVMLAASAKYGKK